MKAKILMRVTLQTALVLMLTIILLAVAAELSPCNESRAFADGEYRLPWPICSTIMITQGNQSRGPSHFPGTYMEYSVDFALKEGDPVAAVREGTVATLQDGMAECGGKEYASKANYVVIDHGDGTSALYLHLQAVSSVISKGNKVQRGEILGLAGKTGWTYCGAHLHFQLQKTGGWWEQSLPISFEEVTRDSLTGGARVHSQNSLVTSQLPKDKWIAFLHENNIWLVHPDGSELTRITKNTGDSPRVNEFKWSPDGQTLAYSMTSDVGTAILLYDVRSSTSASLITGVGSGFDWSLNGKQILFETPFGAPDPWSNKGLWIIHLENQKKRQVLAPSSSHSGFMDPQWSTDGSHVMFVIPAIEPAGYGVADYRTGKTIDLPLNPHGGSGAGNCEWKPSELVIACVTETDEHPYKPELRLLDVNGTILKKVLLPDRIRNSHIKWSPDGTKLAVGYYVDGKSMTDVFFLDSEDLAPLTAGIPSAWSPDGKFLLTWDSGLNVVPAIHIVDTSSGETLFTTEGMQALWQP